MARRYYHNPIGEPCTFADKEGKPCRAARRFHRVEHAPVGSPCTKLGTDGLPCGLSDGRHYRKHNTGSGSLRGRGCYFAGLDGEGQGRDDHRYTSLSWSNESGSQYDTIEALPGERLSTVQCLDFILSTPVHAKLFAFAFNYDLTKMLTDVDNKALYILMRPGLRRRKPGYEKYGPEYVRWKGYSLNLQGSQFTVRKGTVRRTVWDIFKFYQKKFTTVLSDWHESVKAKCPRCKNDTTDCQPCQDWPRHKMNIERMRLMKEQRHKFDQLSAGQVREYCFEECRYMATIARKLVEAVDSAGVHVYGDAGALRLRKFHGAGSIASAFLKRMGIGEEVRTAIDGGGNAIAAMRDPIAAAFAGGRFENRILGAIRRPCVGFDISSAYPYQCTFLPCLACGTWEHTRDYRQLANATQACVRYRLHAPANGKPPPWGPFPFRFKDGSIAFPGASGGGWVWRDEYIAGELLCNNRAEMSRVEFVEAWIYKTECQHRPFADVPKFYVERLRIGKEGPGYILKLGPNAIYGKLAQSIGVAPPYQSWPWAGIVTSGCRAQMLELMALHKDLYAMFMIATDGAYTTDAGLIAPLPRETNTGGMYGADQKGPKPLGGWERKTVDKGMFAARPGIYFPLDPTKEEIEDVRARGLGRAVMFDSWRMALEAWEQGLSEIKVANVTRFHGAKSCIRRGRNKAGAWIFQRADRYGQWTTKPVQLDFNPKPKREYPSDFIGGPQSAPTDLVVRMLPPDLESMPYAKALRDYGPEAYEEFDGYGGEEAIKLRAAMAEFLEQPEGGDYADYELEEYFS